MPSTCDTCGSRPLATHARLQECPDCGRHYCRECALGGGIIEFGECAACSTRPRLRLETKRERRARRA